MLRLIILFKNSCNK